MLDPDLMDDRTLSDILENMPDHWDDDRKLRELGTSSFDEAFVRFMEWNGIVGYNSMILQAIVSLLAAEIPEYEDEGLSLVHDGQNKSLDQMSDVMDDLMQGEALVVTRLNDGKFYVRKLEA